MALQNIFANNLPTILHTMEFDLETLNCSVCTGYLSFAPIHLLSDGSNICGRCSAERSTSSYRQLGLEGILAAAQFPCHFDKYGCLLEFPFGVTADHELKCGFRHVTCSSLTLGDCTWAGLLKQLPDHLCLIHYDIALPGEDVTFKLNKSKQGILVRRKNGSYIIFKYLYHNASRILSYVVVHFTRHGGEEFRIIVCNDLMPSYSITVKGFNCTRFHNDIFNSEKAQVIEIAKIASTLNDPTDIRVTILPSMPEIKADS